MLYRRHVLGMVLCVLAGFCHGSDFGSEADVFLRRMPSGLQARQALAVHLARGGDYGPLRAVRNSRNGSVCLASGVDAEELPGGHRLYRPTGAQGKALPLLVYLHGGGWAFGSVNSCARFCAELCAQAKVLVLGVTYRLAPDCPFPACLEDCAGAVTLAAKQAVAWGGSPERIFVGGDSAGGNLALTVARRLQGKVSLRGLVLFYPVVKAWNDQSVSWRQFEKGYGLDGKLMEEFNLAYCGTASPSLPEVSPACASDEALKALPPILQVNAERDILRSQGEEFVARLKRLGVPVDHHVFKGAVHLFITVNGQEGAFREAVRLTERFMTERKRMEP